MTSNDVRDVLELPDRPNPTPSTTKSKAKAIPEKRPDGLTRELYALLGNNSPPISLVPKKFKEKPKFKQKASSWVWTPFEIQSRGDHLKLAHWTRGTQANTVDMKYRFEVFDKHLDVISYSDEEYATYLESTSWSKEETDYLIKMAVTWDLRFFLIYDRWEFDSLEPRTVEMLKDRYYSIARALLGSRGLPTEHLQYDFQKETTRKKYLENLAQRTPEEIEEENMLIIESRRLEAYDKQLAVHKAEILRTLDAPLANGNIAQYSSSQALGALAQSMLSADKNKHKKRPSEAQSASSSASRPQKVRKLTTREEREYGVSWHDKLTPGAYLRSQKTVALKQTIAAKVQAAMAELHVSTSLTMPTEKTVKKYDALQQAIGILLEAKKVLDKLKNTEETA